MKHLLSFLVFFIFSGCHAHAYYHKKPTKETAKSLKYKPPARCKQIGLHKDSTLSVLVQKDCLKPGLTTVAIFVAPSVIQGAKAKEAMNVIAKKAWQVMVHILRFKPKLALITANHPAKTEPLILLYAIIGEQEK